MTPTQLDNWKARLESVLREVQAEPHSVALFGVEWRLRAALEAVERMEAAEPESTGSRRDSFNLMPASHRAAGVKGTPWN